MREGLFLLKFVQVTCKFATSDKTAHAGVDYEQTEGELVFADSETKKEIKINIFDDEACALSLSLIGSCCTKSLLHASDATSDCYTRDHATPGAASNSLLLDVLTFFVNLVLSILVSNLSPMKVVDQCIFTEAFVKLRLTKIELNTCGPKQVRKIGDVPCGTYGCIWWSDVSMHNLGFRIACSFRIL